jgi:hypothetical protein
MLEYRRKMYSDIQCALNSSWVARFYTAVLINTPPCTVTASVISVTMLTTCPGTEVGKFGRHPSPLIKSGSVGRIEGFAERAMLELFLPYYFRSVLTFR